MHAKRPDRAKMIALAANMIMLLGLCWISIPEHRRVELGMHVSRRMRRETQRLAQMMGRWAVRHDLAGEQDAAQAAYDMAFRIMTGPYAAAVRQYERARGAQ